MDSKHVFFRRVFFALFIQFGFAGSPGTRALSLRGKMIVFLMACAALSSLTMYPLADALVHAAASAWLGTLYCGRSRLLASVPRTQPSRPILSCSYTESTPRPSRWTRYSGPQPRSELASLAAKDVPGVTILRPLRGLDCNLYENLESSFLQEYPKFDIVFSVAEEGDAAIAIVEDLMAKYPEVDAQIIIGETVAAYGMERWSDERQSHELGTHARLAPLASRFGRTS